jgi:hypothetical protein
MEFAKNAVTLNSESTVSKCNVSLSNRFEAVLVGVSAGLGAFGTAATVIPELVPVEYEVQSLSRHGWQAS